MINYLTSDFNSSCDGYDEMGFPFKFYSFYSNKNDNVDNMSEISNWNFLYLLLDTLIAFVIGIILYFSSVFTLKKIKKNA
ncbi:MAG TPA: hypothetical protein PK431_07185 [Chitinophagales bacterium]|nr:hypothetical protein [Chitinophagales bacterium]